MLYVCPMLFRQPKYETIDAFFVGVIGAPCSDQQEQKW
jgi:hypothetical protein